MNPHHCKHFNGDHHNKVCRADVVYDDVTTEPKRTQGLALRRPCRQHCFGHPNSSPSQLAEFAKRGTCAKFELPTAAEITADDESFRIYSQNCTKARAAIVEHDRIRQQSSGELLCPICGTGKLCYGIARCNGHIRGSCTTTDCVNWIE